jgi:hypothetical protein
MTFLIVVVWLFLGLVGIKLWNDCHNIKFCSVDLFLISFGPLNIIAFVFYYFFDSTSPRNKDKKFTIEWLNKKWFFKDVK